MSDLPPEGSVDRPYYQQPPRQFLEVHWSGGLAVHFGQGAGPPADEPPP